MKYAHHALELYEAPRDQILAATREFLSNAGFDVGLSSPSDPSIRAERGSHIGVTDQQTARIMEVIVRGSGDLTAVSVYHHTTNLGPIVGATVGDILSNEVNALLQSLAETASPSR